MSKVWRSGEYGMCVRLHRTQSRHATDLWTLQQQMTTGMMKKMGMTMMKGTFQLSRTHQIKI
eukprot:4475142-Karenia_brevis.AAC.1